MECFSKKITIIPNTISIDNIDNMLNIIKAYKREGINLIENQIY
jgi:hypothetical protein